MQNDGLSGATCEHAAGISYQFSALLCKDLVRCGSTDERSTPRPITAGFMTGPPSPQLHKFEGVRQCALEVSAHHALLPRGQLAWKWADNMHEVRYSRSRDHENRRSAQLPIGVESRWSRSPARDTAHALEVG